MVAGNEQFKSAMRHKINSCCLRDHHKVKELPVKVLEQIDLASTIAIVYTCRTYNEFISTYLRIRKDVKLFDPTLGLLNPTVRSE